MCNVVKGHFCVIFVHPFCFLSLILILQPKLNCSLQNLWDKERLCVRACVRVCTCAGWTLPFHLPGWETGFPVLFCILNFKFWESDTFVFTISIQCLKIQQSFCSRGRPVSLCCLLQNVLCDFPWGEETTSKTGRQKQNHAKAITE